MTVGRAALIMLIKKYVESMLDSNITLLEIHKLMYFMQISGEKLKLKYNKASYGPYAQNLRHVLSVIEGHFIQGFGEGTEDPRKVISVLPNAYEKADLYLKTHLETKKRIERVSKLIDGFETPYGMELLSSIHWIVDNEHKTNFERIVESVLGWSDRKRRILKSEHIEIALGRLKEQGWITCS